MVDEPSCSLALTPFHKLPLPPDSILPWELYNVNDVSLELGFLALDSPGHILTYSAVLQCALSHRHLEKQQQQQQWQIRRRQQQQQQITVAPLCKQDRRQEHIWCCRRWNTPPSRQGRTPLSTPPRRPQHTPSCTLQQSNLSFPALIWRCGH